MNTVRRLMRPEQIREFSLVLIILLVIVFFGSQIPSYYEPRTFNRIASSVMIITVVAVGQTLVVLTRNIDLSVGSIVGFTAYFVGTQLSNNPGLSPPVIVLMSLAVGAIMGVINGALVAHGRIPSIIVTLGTLAIYRGFLVEYSGARTVTTANLPDWISDIARVNLFTVGEVEVRVLVVVAVLVVLLFQFIVDYLPFGRRLYAMGSNPEAARIAGLPARRILLTAFTLSGMLAGFGGLMFLIQYGNITVVAAQGLELQVVAAAVVGGVNIFGGSGTMIGAMLGAILIGTLDQSLIRIRTISEFWKDAILGLFILLAIASDAAILNRLRAIWSRSELIVRDTAEPAGGD